MHHRVHSDCPVAPEVRPSTLPLAWCYLQEDPSSDHPSGDGLLVIAQTLALPQFLVQFLVDVLQHKAQGTLDNMHHILTADQEET